MNSKLQTLLFVATTQNHYLCGKENSKADFTIMKLRYGLNDRPATGQLLLYSLQWFVLAVAVVVTSLFISTGTPAEKILYAQKVFALMGVATIVQVFWDTDSLLLLALRPYYLWVSSLPYHRKVESQTPTRFTPPLQSEA